MCVHRGSRVWIRLIGAFVCVSTLVEAPRYERSDHGQDVRSGVRIYITINVYSISLLYTHGT